MTAKVRAVLDYKLSESVQELRTFLGMLRHLKNASENQAILHEYLKEARKKDKRKIDLNPEAIKKIDLCKQDLVDAALLTHPGQITPWR